MSILKSILAVLAGFVVTEALSAGTVGSLIATIMTWNMPIGPHWYPIVITITALSSAWLGGKLHEMPGGRGTKEVCSIQVLRFSWLKI